MLEVVNVLKEKMKNRVQIFKKGCIPGSKNIPFQDCIDTGTNTFKKKSELIKIFKENDVDYSKPNVLCVALVSLRVFWV